jgi:hypothetical protein
MKILLLPLIIAVARGVALALPRPAKIMIIGDSISQGHEGDYTWRYRLWEWSQSNVAEVDFVGPYNGAHGPDAPVAPSPPLLQGETQPTLPDSTTAGFTIDVLAGFDHDHFSLWGQ